MYTNVNSSISFNGKNITIHQKYRTYFYMEKYDEWYECIPPIFSIHNLIVGQLYVDIGETMTISSQKNPNVRTEIRFERKGFFSGELGKYEGEAFEQQEKVKAKKLEIKGRWHKNCVITNLQSGEAKEVWKKVPFPEKVDWMYGMSHFHVQLNYLPKRLKGKIAPTDSRFRPDQRALENGDMTLA